MAEGNKYLSSSDGAQLVAYTWLHPKFLDESEKDPVQVIAKEKEGNIGFLKRYEVNKAKLVLKNTNGTIEVSQLENNDSGDASKIFGTLIKEHLQSNENLYEVKLNGGVETKLIAENQLKTDLEDDKYILIEEFYQPKTKLSKIPPNPGYSQKQLFDAIIGTEFIVPLSSWSVFGVGKTPTSQ